MPCHAMPSEDAMPCHAMPSEDALPPMVCDYRWVGRGHRALHRYDDYGIGKSPPCMLLWWARAPAPEPYTGGHVLLPQSPTPVGTCS